MKMNKTDKIKTAIERKTKYLVIAKQPQTPVEAIYVAGFDDYDQLTELHFYVPSQRSLVGNIYSGMVVNKVKGIGSYFIDIGQDKNGLLPIEDQAADLMPGDTVIVQVKRDAYQEKGAKLTTKFTIPGQYSVLITDSNRLLFSNRLAEDQRSKQIRSIFRKYKTEKYGFIIRSNSYFAKNQNIKDEIEQQIKHYQRICQYGEFRKPKQLIYQPENSWLKYIHNMDKTGLVKILVESPADCQRIEPYLEQSGLHSVSCVVESELYRRYDLDKLVEKALRKRVYLKSGAELVIEKTEALTVIDVNSNKNNSKSKKDLNWFKINLEAAVEIARQLRIRDLSGIILIDFIDMQTGQYQEALFAAMEQLTEADYNKVHVIDYTRLGIMELTRQRQEESLAEKYNRLIADETTQRPMGEDESEQRVRQTVE